MVVVYKNMVGLGGLARWVTLQHYFGTTQLKCCRPLIYTMLAVQWLMRLVAVLSLRRG